MVVSNVGIARNDVLQDTVGVGLAENLDPGDCVDGRIAHGKETGGKLRHGVEVFPDLLDGLAYLHDGIQFKIPRATTTISLSEAVNVVRVNQNRFGGQSMKI